MAENILKDMILTVLPGFFRVGQSLVQNVDDGIIHPNAWLVGKLQQIQRRPHQEV